MSKALVVLSGGQDSCYSTFWAKTNFDEVHAITFDYGQRHVVELDAARKIGQLAGVASHEILALGPVLTGRSPLTNPTEQLETYKDFESMGKIIGDRIELTFVPMRNALFLVLAANRASCLEIDNIVTGVCEADGANYPDCRMMFIDQMNSAINEALAYELTIHAPLITKTKSESVLDMFRFPGCYHAMGYSHTAYSGEYPPVTRDHASVLRAHGFEEAGVADPLIVRAVLEGLMEIPDTKNYKVLDESLLGSTDDILRSLEILYRRQIYGT